MIKATELRIGNLVYLDSVDNPIEIGLHHFYSAHLDAETMLDYRPIPLTAEWLERFGFVKDANTYKNTSKMNIHFSFYEGNIFIGDNTTGTWYLSAAKYVHQLQNLYHALTGTELELKK